jgi:DeoR family transcriptional regulator, aga operon transcriptional repressor
MNQDSFSNVERQQKILEFLNRQQRISVIDICKMFSISEATARRDLEVLTEQNHLQRVHGGAISLKEAPPELPILQRESSESDEKKRIGLAAASMVNDGETIFLGSGTTVLEAARALKEHKGLTVVSNSLPVLNTLSGLPDITVVALGGVLRSSELSFIGHITEQALAEVRADKVLIGVHAINLEHGLTNDYLPETMTDRAILKSGREVIVLADHTKMNTVSTAFLTPITSIHKLITDRGTPEEFIAALKEKGIEVRVA